MNNGNTSPSQHQLRAKLEAMVLGELLGPAGGEGEELTECTVMDHYLVGVLASGSSTNAAAHGWTDLNFGNNFHETKQGARFTICETARREVLSRLLKLNDERYAEEVKQGLDKKKKASAKNFKSKKQSQMVVKEQATFFDLLEDES